MKPTLRDIAQQSGVSPTTVSLVLGNKGNISTETRDLVRQTAEKLGYERTRKDAAREDSPSKNLGLLFVIDASFSYLFGFIRPIIESLEKRVREDGFDVVLIPISQASSDEEILRKVLEARVEAVAALHYGNINAFIRLEDHDIPIVVVMNNKHQDKYYSVCSDDFHGAYEGTKHLIDLGHRRIAYIGCDRFDLEALTQDRYIGFMKAVNASGLEFDPSMRVDADNGNMDVLRRRMSELFGRDRPPTGLFVLDDELALRVKVALDELGLSVPRDVSIIAPGDVLDYSKPYVPGITTMRINTDLIGTTTGELLVNRIKHAKEKLYVLKVNQELVDRGSCAPPSRY